MNFFKRNKPESPDELERAGYVQTAQFMRWLGENGVHLLMRDVEVMIDLARGDSVSTPCGRFFLEENKREVIFSSLNKAIKAGEELGVPRRNILTIALEALDLSISKFERIREAS